MTTLWLGHERHHRAEVGHPGGDRHRHREHVVDQQRAGHRQPEPRAEVDRGHLVVAAAGRVGVHVLPVAGDHGQHHHDDGERDPRREHETPRRRRWTASAGSRPARTRRWRARRRRRPAARCAWAAGCAAAGRTGTVDRAAAASAARWGWPQAQEYGQHPGRAAGRLIRPADGGAHGTVDRHAPGRTGRLGRRPSGVAARQCASPPEGPRVHVVIMGCGRVGSTLAHSLESRGHSVAVIDQDADAFRRLGPDFAGITVTGVGFDGEVLRQAGIERADAFAAVSSGDNSNIISARLARETFGVSRVAARIYDQSAPRSTSGWASRPWPPCGGPPTGWCATWCPRATSRSSATRPARCRSSRCRCTRTGSAGRCARWRRRPAPGWPT